jgi:hypothetical protein
MGILRKAYLFRMEILIGKGPGGLNGGGEFYWEFLEKSKTVTGRYRRLLKQQPVHSSLI